MDAIGLATKLVKAPLTCQPSISSSKIPWTRRLLRHRVEHHRFDKPAVEFKHDTAAAIDAYPFLRGHSTRHGKPFVAHQLVSEPRLAIKAIRALFQGEQRLGQDPTRMAYKTGSHPIAREHCNGRVTRSSQISLQAIERRPHALRRL